MMGVMVLLPEDGGNDILGIGETGPGYATPLGAAAYGIFDALERAVPGAPPYIDILFPPGRSRTLGEMLGGSGGMLGGSGL